MGRDDFRYSAQLQVDDEWCWFLETNELSEAKHHLRCRINKNPELNGRVVDKKTGETVFIDSDPNALKIRFRRDDDEDWQRLEITYVDDLRRLVHLRELTAEEGEAAFEQFLRLTIRLSHQRGIFPLAWKLPQAFNRPRAYDTAYLVLAQLRGCDFWTADERLYNAVRHELAWVKWLGDARPDDLIP